MLNPLRPIARLGAVVLVVAAAVAGCSGEPEPVVVTPSPTPPATPSPTPSPSLDPAEALKEANIAEATAALEEYVRLSNEVANNGGEGWDQLDLWWGNPEMWESGQRYYEAVQESGSYTTGTTSIVEMNVIEYQADSSGDGLEVVQIRYCLDVSGTNQHQADGTIVDRLLPDRYLISVSLQHQGVGERWTVNESTALTDQEC